MRHWVFDLDGTLVDSFGPYDTTMREIFAEKGVEWSAQHFIEALSTSPAVLIERYIGANAVAECMAKLRVRANEDARRIRPYEGIVETLAHLREQGSRVAVWTGRDLESAQIIIESSGLGALVESCTSGTCVQINKPNPEGLLRVVKSFNCRADEVYMVGDHDHDMMAAREVGAQAVRVKWNPYWSAVECQRAHHQFEHVRDFATWLGKL